MASLWGRGGQGTSDSRAKIQRKLPIRADAAGLLQLRRNAPVKQVQRIVNPLLKAWKWSPALATHALKTLAKSSYVAVCLHTLDVMRAGEVTPLTAHYNAALIACADLKKWKLALFLLDRMEEDKVAANDATVEETMRSCRAWQNALSLWMMLRNREPGLTVTSHTWAMSAVGSEAPLVALEIFQNVVQDPTIGEPDAFSYLQAIVCYGRLEQWQDSIGMLAEMSKNDIAADSSHFTAIITSLRRCSLWQRALSFWHRVKAGAEVPCYGSIVATLAEAQQWSNALEVLTEMVQQELDPQGTLRNLMTRAVALSEPNGSKSVDSEGKQTSQRSRSGAEAADLGKKNAAVVSGLRREIVSP